MVNELEVGANSTLGTRSSDTVITTRVKSALIDAKDVQASAIKVDHGARQRLPDGARHRARSRTRRRHRAGRKPSVLKVVRVFEILTEEQLGNLH